jgi:hypothetical protein
MELADRKCSDGGSVLPLEAPREQELLRQLPRGFMLLSRGTRRPNDEAMDGRSRR